MNTTEMISEYAKRTGVTKAEASKVVEATLLVLADAIVSGNEVSLPLIGKFVIVEKAERQGRNPATGNAITIAASRAIKFKPGKALKDRL